MKKRKKPNSSERLAKAKRSGVFLLFSSVLGMLFCVAMLIGSSWAWFTSQIQAPQTITVAQFQVMATITDEEGNAPALENGSYFLCDNMTYQISLTATGTASEGYCVVRCGDRVYCTEQIPQGATMTFAVTPATDTYCDVSAMWGRCVENPTIFNGSVLGEKRPEPTEETTAPSEEETEPPEEPTQDVSEPTESTPPATEPTGTGNEPTLPPEEPTQPTEESTQPPVEPTQPPVEQPTEPPTESPTEPPTQPPETDPSKPPEPTENTQETTASEP